MGDLESNSICIRRYNGKIDTLISDKRIKWADSFTLSRSGFLYFTNSRINESLGDIDTLYYKVYKIRINNI